eukprot:tig00000241_g21018.t1
MAAGDPQAPERLRIVTWNVNGLNRQRESLRQLLDGLGDIVCLQETKLTKVDVDVGLVDGYHGFFSSDRARRPYSGTATYTRSAKPFAIPTKAEEGATGVYETRRDAVGTYGDLHLSFSASELRTLDCEGRVVVTDHGAFVLLNCYFPNAHGGERQAFKLRFQTVVQLRVKALLDSGRHVIVVGDFNAMRDEKDHAEAATWKSDHGLSSWTDHPANAWLRSLLRDSGGPLVDVFREFWPDRCDAFTCWSTVTRAREANYGTRIDYILADSGLVNTGVFLNCDIAASVMGSDHAPVFADLDLSKLPAC